MTIKTLCKWTALAGILAFGALPAHAGKVYDLYTDLSSGTLRIGYPGVNRNDAVFTSSGAAVIQSTSATSGYAVLRVLNYAGAEILKMTQAGVLTVSSFVGNLTGNVVGNLTGNSSGTHTGAVVGNADTATALAANGANCSAGNYPLGVDSSGAVEGCTAAGVGDVTQAGGGTFASGSTVNMAAGSLLNMVNGSTFTLNNISSGTPTANGLYQNMFAVVSVTFPSTAGLMLYSVNVTSITYFGTGQYQVNFARPFASATAYGCTMGIEWVADTTIASGVFGGTASQGFSQAAKGAASIGLNTFVTGGTNTNFTNITVTCYGKQ